MRISDIEFPKELINAQREGTLVIFAGAGVSMDPPSKLPNFLALATKIAERVSKPLKKGEPLDQFLGRLTTGGVDVHTITHEIIRNPDSKPNPLHRIILSLFSSPSSIRLITTNFDRHFTTVARELFPGGVDSFIAPALPLGHKFNGIVYLHGCIDHPSNELVLTDCDFGQAYLTDGWASRFLQAVFANFTVLFVGYGHDDPVMHYFSRALPPGSGKRYALTVSGKDEQWIYFGIAPLPYKKAKGRYPHSPLRESLELWNKLTKRGVLDHEQRIKELVEVPPPIDDENQDYLRYVLSDVVNVRFFTRYAKTPDWMRWAEDNLQPFRDLFKPACQESVINQELELWFANNFVKQNIEEALALIQRREGVICSNLWNRIALKLCSGLHPDPMTFGKWVSFLLSTTREDVWSDPLGLLLNNCHYPEDKETAILLFDYITHPRINLRRHFSLSNDDCSLVDIEISLQKETYWLNDAWNKMFKPNLSYFAEKLVSIVESHLRLANIILRSIGKASEQWDEISFSRHAIESHEQDKNRSDNVILIDTARDIIDFLFINLPSQASHIIESWSNSSVPILQRLAVHGMSGNTLCSADDKIGWLLSRGWLYMFGIRHEVFRLLELAYPDASQRTRLKLLKQVELGPERQDANAKDKDKDQYEIYNLLTWLSKADPGCTIVSKRLEKIKKANPDFCPSEYPDLYSWGFVGFHSVISPITKEELLKTEPADAIDFLLCYSEDNFRGPSREGLLNTITEAVSHSFDWSWRLVETIQSKKEPDIYLDLWESLIRGWQRSSLTEQQWVQVLNLINGHLQLTELGSTVTDLLKQAVTEQQATVPPSCLTLVESIADKLWAESSAKSPEEMKSVSDNWLDVAINSIQGEVVEIWLHTLSKRRAEVAKTWSGIPTEFKARFEAVLSGKSVAAQLGRVLLASQIQFLFALDPDWVEVNVLPLLDWSINENRAEQAWHGYLVWGRWNNAMLPKLLPLYKQTFTNFKNKLPIRLRESFCRHLAQIAIFSTEDPLKDGWLWDFLKTVDAADRKIWAAAVRYELDSVGDESAKGLWDRWMSKYWSNRITGVPVPLTPDELEEMVYWATELTTVFPEVVDRICASSAPRLKNTNLYHILKERQFDLKHPVALTKLLIHLLSNAAEPFWQCTDVENLVRALIKTPVERSELIRVCHQLARLGCDNAAELKKLCDEN